MNSADGVRRVLLCPPATVVPPAGSYERRCADCQRGVWVEQGLIKEVDALSLRTLCITCVRVELARADAATIGLLPGQKVNFGGVEFHASAPSDLLRMKRGTATYRVLMETIDELARDEY